MQGQPLGPAPLPYYNMSQEVTHATLLRVTIEVQKDHAEWMKAFEANRRDALVALMKKHALNINAAKTIADALGFPRERHARRADPMEERLKALEHRVNELCRHTGLS